MALADTGRAIRAVTEALQQRLNARTGATVTVGRPAPGDLAAPTLNLFLYELQFDPHLKNVPLDEGQRPPLWLVLKYLMTAFDNKESDTFEAHGVLGEGIRALQGLNTLPLAPGLTSDVLKALNDNPEDLKITFDEVSSDLIAKVMQGQNEKYRFSVGFQVRPVMIASDEPASYSLLVGVDYTTAPAPTVIGEEGVQIPVIPSLGATITEISPAAFEVGDTITIYGEDLHLSGLSVMLGAVELPVIAQQPDQLKCLISEELVTGDVISAGSHAVAVAQTLVTGRRRMSNLLIGNLLPTLDAVGISTLVAGPPIIFAVDVSGRLLGKREDDVYLAFYKDGKSVKVFDSFADEEVPPPAPPDPPQTEKRLKLKAGTVAPGKYLLLLRVNGQQAKQSAVLEIVP
ncbi:MAG TPA: DUF4255 domain-containing protein [Pyrinomonadaceae bacterium]|nr:DUF4255 domain-containing protein [Pyrinomonadaceae bacterium]